MQGNKATIREAMCVFPVISDTDPKKLAHDQLTMHGED